MNQPMVRPELPEDAASIRAVNLSAFGQPGEADLVDALRSAGKVTVSLVAVVDGRVAGHILFSPVTIASEGGEVEALGLGPMAVVSDLQRRRIGGALVERGLEVCRAAGHDRVVVLGHAEYYPRFGFVPASRFGVGCEYDVPDDVFMALELRPGAFEGVSGTARYAPEFGDV